MSTPKVAIVADWLTDKGGAERYVYELHRIFPDAPIYTSTLENKEESLFKDVDVRTSWLQKLPKPLRRYQLHTLPRQWHFGRLQLHDYDVVISIGSSEAKAVRAPDGVHINICYTPTLYYWVKTENYLGKGGSGGVNPLWKLGLKLLTPYVKKWDYNAAQRPDVLYAISSAVQDRIQRFYDRNSGIIAPPVNTARFANKGEQERNGFIIWGRQVQHKRFDLAVEACNIAGAKLLVVVDRPEHDRLRSLAGPTITFKTNVPDDELTRYIQSSEAFILPNEEDFGIVAAEAQAAGTPVIGYRAGGALDIIIEGKTGEFFDEQTPDSIAEVLRTFNPKRYKHAVVTKNAQRFSEEALKKHITTAITNALKEHSI